MMFAISSYFHNPDIYGKMYYRRCERKIKHIIDWNNEMIKTLFGDITEIDNVDAIVNIANTNLLSDDGADAAIHSAAGSELLKECKTLQGCEVGEAKLTKAYKLPCKYIIHTVGPSWSGGKDNEAELLANCYYHSLSVAVENGIRSVAFPSISTGLYGFPVQLAARIAVSTVSRFLEEHVKKIDLVEWVLSDQLTESIYEHEVDNYYK